MMTRVKINIVQLHLMPIKEITIKQKKSSIKALENWNWKPRPKYKSKASSVIDAMTLLRASDNDDEQENETNYKIDKIID